MSSEYIDVQGKIKFIHALNMNKYDKWSVTFYPTNESREKIYDLQAQGVKNVMKKDEDNQYYIQFSREPTKLMRGKVVAFAAPKVFQVVDGKVVPFDGSKIGRDSDATIRLEVYQHGTPNGGKAKAARWDSIRIDNLVEWNPDKDMSTEDAEAVKDLAKSPQPMWD